MESDHPGTQFVGTAPTAAQQREYLEELLANTPDTADDPEPDAEPSDTAGPTVHTIDPSDWTTLLSHNAGAIPVGVRLSRKRPARPGAQPDPDIESVWRIALRRAGRLGPSIGDGKHVVWCVNDSEHSAPCGSLANANDGTVLFPPGSDQSLGFPYCSHAHCASLTARDWIEAIGSEVWSAASAEVRTPPRVAPVVTTPPTRDPGEDDDQPAPESDPNPNLTPPETADTWRQCMTLTARGDPASTFRNLCLILRYDDTYGENLCYNKMRLTPELSGVPVDDAMTGHIREAIERDWKIQPGSDNIRCAIRTVADERGYHPVQQYLQSLAWDGVERIEACVPQILQAEPTPLNLTVLKSWFISAVARVWEPGCKVDTSLVLVGDQGCFKSSFFRALSHPWFADSAIDIANKDALMQLHDTWLYELPEIESITSQKHAGQIKAFCSSQVDTFRPPYGMAVVKVPRTNVVVGSTNEPRFLEDPTGSRRFWTIDIPRGCLVDIATAEEWRDQLWAEAVTYYLRGDPWHLDPEMEAERKEQAEDHRVRDPWEHSIEEYLTNRTRTCPLTTREILTDLFHIELSAQHRGHENKVGSILRTFGYAHRRKALPASRDEGGGMQKRTFIYEWLSPSQVVDIRAESYGKHIGVH